MASATNVTLDPIRQIKMRPVWKPVVNVTLHPIKVDQVRLKMQDMKKSMVAGTCAREISLCVWRSEP